jgi:hypothetical protein
LPNGATRPQGTVVTPKGELTSGTETSKYLEEREINRDAQSSGERTGYSPNRGPCGRGVVGPTYAYGEANRSPLERGAKDGDSPVGESDEPYVVEFLSNARLE